MILLSRHQISKIIRRLRRWRALLKCRKDIKREIQEVYPLTNTQEGIFIECTANMGTTIYNIPYLFKLDRRVDLDKTGGAIDSTVKAHPISRHVCLWMRMEMFFRDVMMICHAEHRFLTEWIGRRLFAHICCLTSSFSDLRFTEPATEIIYSWILHHIIADGTSLEIIINDINRAYSGETLEDRGVYFV